jgi:microsomal dipeptidase-like Zn-dependent dipeptidase
MRIQSWERFRSISPGPPRTGGVSEHNIRLIMDENFVRVLSETLPD